MFRLPFPLGRPEASPGRNRLGFAALLPTGMSVTTGPSRIGKPRSTLRERGRADHEATPRLAKKFYLRAALRLLPGYLQASRNAVGERAPAGPHPL